MLLSFGISHLVHTSVFLLENFSYFRVDLRPILPHIAQLVTSTGHSFLYLLYFDFKALNLALFSWSQDDTSLFRCFHEQLFIQRGGTCILTHFFPPWQENRIYRVVMLPIVVHVKVSIYEVAGQNLRLKLEIKMLVVIVA